jgi:hypothetical protein
MIKGLTPFNKTEWVENKRACLEILGVPPNEIEDEISSKLDFFEKGLCSETMANLINKEIRERSGFNKSIHDLWIEKAGMGTKGSC